MKNRKKTLLLPLLLVLPLALGCTNKQGETEAPIFITVELKDQPGFVDVCSQTGPVQFLTINLNSHFKNPNTTDPLHLQDVQMDNYTVTYTRLDGGTKVPPPETFTLGALLPSGGTTTLKNFFAMYASAFNQSPLDQLFPYNGGIDQETGRTEIDLGFTFQFFGETAAGQRVASDPSTAEIIFTCGAPPVGTAP